MVLSQKMKQNANILTFSLKSSNSIVGPVGKNKMNDVYNIKHCIHCGQKGFETTEAVIKHIKAVHTKLQPGENLEELDGYD